MADIIKVVGVGPGSYEYLTAAGATAIKQAEVVVGANRLIQEFALPNQQTYSLGADLKAAVEFIKGCYQSKRVVVLVTGDTGLYSFASYLADQIPGNQLEFIPGISSVQLMFARLQLPWHNTVVISRHGREDNRLPLLLKAGLITVVLTDYKNTPQVLARELLEYGFDDIPVSVGSKLSCPDEMIFRGTLNSLSNSDYKFNNSVVIFGV